LVGRETDLAFLQERLAKALNGERQVVFVTGEPGIGKTTLLEAFVAGVRDQEESQRAKVPKAQSSAPSPQSLSFPNPQAQFPNPGVWVGGGQCIEHYGAGEAYLPVLEALGRLCRDSEGERLRALLHQHAPSWLVQLPSLLGTPELEELQRRTAGVTRERMLRELAQALEVITVERPLVLVLEDLHWSDVSTLDLLSMLARRQERAQILIIGSYRPVEVLSRDHPLKGVKQELQVHGQCEELALDFLSEGAVGEYLAQRLGAPSPAAAGEGWGESLSQATIRKLAHLIHQRTDGNPLFMVNMTNELIAHGVETRHVASLQSLEELDLGVPENLRQLIEHQLTRVNPDERRILEAASVAGAEFSAAAVAAGSRQSTEAVETYCDSLVRRGQFLRAQGTGEWPDGTIAARYGFVHALYQEVLYDQISATRRSRLHRQIGEREEQGYGNRAREIAAELAVHFERGRDYPKAIQYLQHAGENALRRSAHQEAIGLLTRGLELLKTLPDTPERAQHELTLQLALNDALVAAKGYTAPEVEKTVTRARELSRQLGEIPQLVPVLFRLWVFYTNRGELQTAHELSKQMMRLAQSAQDPYLLSMAHAGLGVTLYWLGELTSARPHVEQAIALYDPQQHPRSTIDPADPQVGYLTYAAFTLWHLGYPAQALKRSQKALALAEELSHPYSLALALWGAAWFHLLRREGQFARERAEAVITLSTEQGFPYGLAVGTFVQSWALAEQGQVQEGIAQMRPGRAPLNLALLAEAYGKVGQVEEGLTVLAKALARVEKTGERVYEAELDRLKGELLLVQESQKPVLSVVEGAKGKVQKSKVETSPQSLVPNTQGEVEQEAERYFLKAIEVARRQQAKSWELRASTSLARLWQQQGKKEEAQQMLVEIYGWFTEGFDTKDLQEAKALLEELRRC
jgi:tetratricopeptide (TPR) repeat protein